MNTDLFSLFVIYFTLLGQCQLSYKANWKPGLEGHCPNLVPTEEERQYNRYKNIDTFTVDVERDYEETYDSLADYWTEWYREFMDADFPRLIIRFEDTLFHAEQVMKAVMDCVGQPMERPFKYHLEKSKSSGKAADFAGALGKYGSEKGRYDGLAMEDKEYLRSALDATLMRTFHYPPISEDYYEDLFDDKIADVVFQFDACEGKEELLGILLRAGKRELTEEDCAAMPTWKEVMALYGDEPVVYGLETCELYRSVIAARNVDPDPRVSGLFNTGTNALVDALDLNFRHVKDRLDYNLPGGKHAFLRNIRWAKDIALSGNPDITFFPVVLIRDPFRWMRSMVRV